MVALKVTPQGQMQILFLTHYFYPKIGGVEKHVYQLSQELIKKQHQVTVLTSKHQPQLPSIQNHRGINIIRINISNINWDKPPKAQLWNWFIKNKTLFQQSDIIHCHDIFFWYLPLRFLLPNRHVYTTFHGYEKVCPPTKKSIIIRKISEKLSTKNICVGKYLQKWYTTKADLITYGATQIPTPPKKQPKPKNKTALFLGRLDPDNCLPRYFKALDILHQQNLNLKVEFCGGGQLETSARKYGQVLGFQSDISPPLFKNRFVFANSYLSMLEAMAHQRLIFATYNTPIKKDILHLTPFKNFINIANSTQQLAEQIQYYLDHPQAEQDKINQAYNWVQTQTWEHLTNQYLKLWRV